MRGVQGGRAPLLPARTDVPLDCADALLRLHHPLVAGPLHHHQVVLRRALALAPDNDEIVAPVLVKHLPAVRQGDHLVVRAVHDQDAEPLGRGGVGLETVEAAAGLGTAEAAAEDGVAAEMEEAAEKEAGAAAEDSEREEEEAEMAGASEGPVATGTCWEATEGEETEASCWKEQSQRASNLQPSRWNLLPLCRRI